MPAGAARPRPLSGQRHHRRDDHDDDEDDDARLALAVAPTPSPRPPLSPLLPPSSPPPPPPPKGPSATAPSTTTTTTTLDAALSKHVGELGPAQVRVCLLASLSWASMAMAVLSLVFLTPDPVHAGAWECAAAAAAAAASARGAGGAAAGQPAADAHAACAALKARQQQRQQQQQQQQSWGGMSGAASGGGPASGAPLPPPPPLTAQSPEFCALPAESWRWTDARASAVATFGLHCGRSRLATAASSALFLGFLAASPAWGRLADRRGRRAAALASGWAAAAASLLTAAAPTLPLLVAGRFLLGAGVAGLPVSAYPLSVEGVGPGARGRAGILSQAVYHVGEWLLPLLAYSLGDWRRLCVAVAAACALTTCLLLAVPESPRWLLVRGREAEARAVLDALARGNGRAEGLPPRLRLGLLSSSSSPPPPPSSPPPPPASGVPQRRAVGGGGGLGALWRHARSRSHLLAASAATCVAAAGFYVCNLVDALPGPLALTFLLTSAGELPFAFGLAYLVDAIGRRPAVAALLAGGGACGALLPLARRPAAQLLAATVAKGAVSAAWGGLVTWSAEMFPTSVRATALGVANQAARLGGAAAPVIVYAAAARGWPEGQFAVAGLACVASAGLVWLALPETRGRPQPDSLQDVDAIFGQGRGGGGEGRPAAAAAAGAEKETALVGSRPTTGGSQRSASDLAPLLATTTTTTTTTPF
jgi:MFS family permease